MRAVILFVLLANMASASAQTAPGAKPSSVLDAIKKRGEIAVGIKADFPLFGARDASGNVVGFEVDLAQNLADRLGVRLKKVVVGNEDRFQKLEQGLIDVTIATAFDTRERRQIATAIEPNYYGAGTTVMLRPESTAKDWQEIRGQTLCALQGASFNRPITQRFIVNLNLYRNTRDALLALKDGRCIGFLHSEASIAHYLQQPEWQGFKSTFTPAVVTPWAISIARSERGTEFERWMGDTVADWHRTGFLIEREKHWGIQPSKFLRDTHALWKEKLSNGNYVCQRTSNGEWPTKCRNQEFLVANDADGLQGFGLWLREYFGIDLSIVYDGYDAKRFLIGILYSILLIICSLATALAVGFIGFLGLIAQPKWLTGLSNALGVYGRLTPPLLQMYFLFFGIGSLMWAAFSIKVSAFSVAVWCTGAYAGCQIMFILFGTANILHSGQPAVAIKKIHVQKLIQHSITPIKGSLINLTKGTTMASSLAVPELLYITIAIIGDRGNAAVMMTILLVIFLIINEVCSGLINIAEKKIRLRLGGAAHV